MTIVIFVALLAFLIGDVFTSGSSMLNSRKMRVGEINGTNIEYVDFLNESDYLGDIYRMMWGRDSFSPQEQEIIYNMAWEQLIMENSFKPGFDRLGMTVSESEQIDMVDGVYLSPVITTTFVNPSTGLFDPQMMKAFMGEINTGDGSYALWSFLRNQMEQERVMSKYVALVSAGFYANSLEVAHGVKISNETFSADVIGKDYYTIPDSLVKVTSAEIKKYYNDHKESFKQGSLRDVEYVVFDVVPSEADYAEAQRTVDEIAAEFATSEAPMQYATLNSQQQPDTKYYRQEELSADLGALAFEGDRSGMYGPVLTGDEYTVSRVANVRMMPDTLGARHILLRREESALADSLVAALRAGADFAALAQENSLDRAVSQNSGDLGRFTPDQVPAEFTEAALTANVGDIYTVESPAGLQIVQLTYKSRPARKAQIATVTYKVDPSAATIQNAYQKASGFVTAAGGTTEGFNQAVNDQSLSKRTVRIRNTERTISGLENSKEIVRWAFNGKRGEVSPIMDIDGDYYIASLVDVKEEGYAPLEQVSEQISKLLINKGKARIIEQEMAGSTLAEAAEAAGVEVREAENVQWSAFYIPGFGVEPQLIGAITAVPSGTLSLPVEGVSGVFRFVVTDVQSADNVTEESEKVRLDSDALYYINERTMQALTEESGIKDMRVKFF